MSNKKLQFAGDIERFMAMFPGLAAYGAEVGKAGSLEQAATEAQGKIDKAKKDFDAEVAALERQRAEYLNEVEKARQAAADASGEVSIILGAAHEEADKIIADAKAKADAHISYAARTVKDSEADYNTVQARIADATLELARVRAAHDNAKRALDEVAAKKKQLQESLDDLKARL